MTSPQPAIAWAQRANRPAHTMGSEGTVGQMRLFSTWWIGGAKPWRLGSRLPGYDTQKWPFADEEAAQAFAERILAAWLGKVGATLNPVTPFTGEPGESPVARGPLKAFVSGSPPPHVPYAWAQAIGVKNHNTQASVLVIAASKAAATRLIAECAAESTARSIGRALSHRPGELSTPDEAMLAAGYFNYQTPGVYAYSDLHGQMVVRANPDKTLTALGPKPRWAAR